MTTAKILTLGSLFDGIGGFPLAGINAGMEPVWASEIEPFSIRVTEQRLPRMKHYGDIHLLSGTKLEPVDVITFGSPCQDLSIAGKRDGLSGARSGLFYQAVRIIREMRDTTDGRHPKWAVWENVPGALSSHDGEDFRQILESLIRIKAPEADVPLPENHKWLPAGEIMGDGYSLAWRVLDAAQGWGVAQRRKRIFVVLDLDGQRAGQVLFESEGVSRYTPPCGDTRQKAATGITESVGTTGCAGRIAGGFCTGQSSDSRSDGYGEERAPTLRGGKPPGVAIGFNPVDGRIRINEDGVCQTLCARMGTGGNQTPLTFGIRSRCKGDGKAALIQCEMSDTLRHSNSQPLFGPVAYSTCSDQNHAMQSANPHAGIYEAKTSGTLDAGGGNPCRYQGGIAVCEPIYTLRPMMNTQVDQEKTASLMARDRKDPIAVSMPAYALDRACFNAGENAQYRMNVSEEVAPTLIAEGPSAVVDVERVYVIRRLTPLECCRLQGFPDGWTENLATEEPTEQEIAKWFSVFEDWYRVNGKIIRPLRSRIIKWLKAPRTDAAEYKAYGNSVAVPCVFFVLAGIVWAEEQEGCD